MSAPKRVQLRRTKGYRKPEGAVVVARPSKWGNPWKAVPAAGDWLERKGEWCVVGNDGCRFIGFTSAEATDFAIGRYRLAIEHDRQFGRNWLRFHYADVADLRGKDLARWCSLDQPCHADVLLELANA